MEVVKMTRARKRKGLCKMPKAHQDKEQNMLPSQKLKMAFSSRNRLNLSFDMRHQTQDFQSLTMY